MEITGKIKLIGQVETFDSGFTKRQLVVTTAEQYPQDLAMDFIKDKTSLLDSFQPGQDVTVAINLRGNEYNGKYFVNLNGWRISAAQTAAPASAPVQASAAQTAAPAPVIPAAEQADDLPF